MRVTLHLDSPQSYGAGGWACCPGHMQRRIWLELLADGHCVAVGLAENFHPAAEGDGLYGFWLPLPPALVDECMELQIRAANTTDILAQWTHSPAGMASPAAEDTPLTQLWHDGALALSGWHVDSAKPRVITRLSAWHGDKKLCSCYAGEHRYQPLLSDGHGFQMHLPLWMADGREYIVDVRDNEQRPLPGSPVRVQVLSQDVYQWLRHGGALSCEQRVLLLRYVQHMQARIPQSVRFADTQAWLRAFPVPADPDGAGHAAEKLLTGYTLLLPAGTCLVSGGLEALQEAARTSKATVVYGDGLLQQGKAVLPLCKPAWDKHLFYAQDYLGPVLVADEHLHALPPGTAETLRIQAILRAQDDITHLPFMVYERTCLPQAGSVHRAQIQEFLQQQIAGVRVDAGPEGYARVHWPLEHRPLVSIIIPTRDRADLLAVCLESLRKTAYPHIQILIVDNGSTEAATHALFAQVQGQGVRILPWKGYFNYSAINNAAAEEATGDYLCFLNNDTELLSSSWLEDMLSLALLPHVGCVGAKLLWPNNVVQHGGVVVGIHQLAGHAGNRWLAEDAGYMGRNLCVQQYSAVTAACMLTPKNLFLEKGGFDTHRFPVAFNDVDYCLRLRQAGKQILWTPHVRILHHESASRGKDTSPMNASRAAMEQEHFRHLWGDYEDPFYNPNLSLSTVCEPFTGLALPPRSRRTR